MEPTRSDQGGQVHHTHPTKPRDECPACTQRFGVVVTTTNSIAAMLSDDAPVESAALVQLVWVTNKHLDRIATALENMGGAA